MRILDSHSSSLFNRNATFINFEILVKWNTLLAGSKVFEDMDTFHNLKKMSLIDTGGLYQCVPDVKNQK